MANCPAPIRVLAVPVTLPPIETKLFHIMLQLLWISQNIIYSHLYSLVMVIIKPTPGIAYDWQFFSDHVCPYVLPGQVLSNSVLCGHSTTTQGSCRFHTGDLDMGTASQYSLFITVGDEKRNKKKQNKTV